MFGFTVKTKSEAEKPARRYLRNTHVNSNRAAKRKEFGWRIKADGTREWVDCITTTMVKDPRGEPADVVPFLCKQGKYTRHVGKKQLLKLASK